MQLIFQVRKMRAEAGQSGKGVDECATLQHGKDILRHHKQGTKRKSLRDGKIKITPHAPLQIYNQCHLSHLDKCFTDEDLEKMLRANVRGIKLIFKQFGFNVKDLNVELNVKTGQNSTDANKTFCKSKGGYIFKSTTNSYGSSSVYRNTYSYTPRRRLSFRVIALIVSAATLAVGVLVCCLRKAGKC